MIEKIVRNTIVLEDGSLEVDADKKRCLFCDKRRKNMIPFRILNEGQEYFVDVPMCRKHEDQFKRDEYKFKLRT